MWRNRLVVVITGVLATLAVVGVAVAASPEATAPGNVPLSGQAVVVQEGSQTQLRLKASATDGTGWLIEAALAPVQQVSEQEGREREDDEGEEEEHEERERGRERSSREAQVISLDGTYTLGQEGLPLMTGAATGQIDRFGTVSLQLYDQRGEQVLYVAVAAQPGGSVVGRLQGLLPVLPQAASDATASVGPATLASDQAGAPVEAPITHVYWYISRTAAVVAYLLLFASMCLGLTMRAQGLGKLLAKWRTFDLHQFTALLAMGFLAVHVFALLGDQYFSFGMKELLLPFASPYRPLWTTLGVLSLYAAVVVTFSFYVRQRIGMKAWRAIHYTSIAVFVGALIHGIKAGADITAPWMQGVYLATGMAAAGLFLWRFLVSQTPQQPATQRGERGRVIAAPHMAQE